MLTRYFRNDFDVVAGYTVIIGTNFVFYIPWALIIIIIIIIIIIR